ncbi:hypothetical protein [Nonomuraea gerenzanensis]|nr:hypothetical protein [Nonomuraea gerenzanensis]UBU10063.1 hypothetical protein LCN96_37680 [Nonomuraea gerenzanensis]
MSGDRSGTPHFRIVPGQRQPEPQHQPWCANHAHSTPGDFGTCESESIDGGGRIPVSIASDPVLGVRFDIGDLTLEGATVDEAEQLMLALSIQVARARGVEMPPSMLAAVTR